MMSDKTIPSDKFTITINGNDYETRLTMGKIRDFEVNKFTYGYGFYNNIQDGLVLDAIDSVSALVSFFPEYKEQSEIKDVFELNPFQMKRFIKDMKPFFKWYLEWREALSNIDKVETKKEKETE